jgi:hypothetical protein
VLDGNKLKLTLYSKRDKHLFCAAIGIITVLHVKCHLNYQNSKSTNFTKTREFPSFVCWNADTDVSMCTEVSATGHLDTGLLVLLCLQGNATVASEIQSSYRSPPDLYSSQLITLTLK